MVASEKPNRGSSGRATTISPLRDFLRTNATLETIVDFGDHQIFEGVTTYPAILTMRAGSPPPGHVLQFWKIGQMPADSFADAFADAAKPFPQEALGRGSWELEGDALRALRAKITAGKPTLKEIYGSPYAGIKTGYNKAFILDAATKDKLMLADPKSADLLRPIVFGNEVHPWRTESRSQWIIYIPKGRVQIDEYPAIRDWLSQFKENLQNRAANQEWFELQQPQYAYVATYNATKLIYRDIADRPTFSVDTGSFIDMTCFCLGGGSYFEAALLNSKAMWFALKSMTTIASGGFFRMKSQYLEPLPIPSTSDAIVSDAWIPYRVSA